ncbi:hypothetical protein NBG4_540015 [Candidatus Sulfobium mesophilum]|uniref:Uncharacterized protein n=1 Tax=Candidatus Sulfobium mesophilum TaxID=2016548 RepID=A0A2U3QJ46_9BACT|nr:hypothetical protein NBG4_540015 [Candidatus Sulfobium mesophilum]
MFYGKVMSEKFKVVVISWAAMKAQQRKAV